ncbi:FAD-binding molybdopterin dehydrogenase [Nakamurella sp. YIM 132087]|uniref:FAD-binding molybdopterin dehydrogenase n=1 Tax=Nakamurella alba TaxID=2665158 RepID=A0A7K1FQE3_9ACTN|nr:FAD binding domain-containing protein [Nakamurella alba]MTD15579.1 FAD-binding molybdopterin dehydrogenase [Nakamurella alba]
MDLNTVTAIVPARSRADLAGLGGPVAVLAGGTWLFSESQDTVEQLVDLTTLGWTPLEHSAAGLEVAATCTVQELYDHRLPDGYGAAGLLRQCCEAYLASFKIWRFATVGGNLCLGFPAGPMISLTASLDGVCTIWTPDGGLRTLLVMDFVTGPATTALRSGEVLRSILLPDQALRERTAFRKIALSPLGRSGSVVIGRRTAADGFELTLTGGTVRPIRLSFAADPGPGELLAAVDGLDASVWHHDAHGTPDWRHAVSAVLAEEIRVELFPEAAP